MTKAFPIILTAHILKAGLPRFLYAVSLSTTLLSFALTLSLFLFLALFLFCICFRRVVFVCRYSPNLPGGSHPSQCSALFGVSSLRQLPIPDLFPPRCPIFYPLAFTALFFGPTVSCVTTVKPKRSFLLSALQETFVKTRLTVGLILV